MRKATNIARDNLISVGTRIGKFTKTRRFRLHITALDFMAPYAKYKVWVKPSGEQSFLYGNHVLKSNLGRITENTPQYQGVIIYSMNDLPLGFGATARSTQDCRRANPTDIVCFHQADVGEYLRSEETLTWFVETKMVAFAVIYVSLGSLCRLKRNQLNALLRGSTEQPKNACQIPISR